MSKHAAYWAEVFEKANLCMDRIGNTRACYRGEYACDVQDKAEAFEDHIREALAVIGAHQAQKEDWKVVKAVAAMYDELKASLPKVAALEPDAYDRQMADKFRVIAERAAAAEESFTDKEPDVNKGDKLKEITEKLEQGIMDVFSSDKYVDYLKTMSKFHGYSLNNTIMIFLQKPDAQAVAGYKAWQQKFGRQVKKGEKGISILAPAPYKVKKLMEKIDPETQQPVLDKEGKPVTELVEHTYANFKVVSVFDVSQTEGKELPRMLKDNLVGDVANYEQVLDTLKAVSPVPIDFEVMGESTHGYYHLDDKRIAIRKNMSEIQTIKTSIHEIAHAKLHAITDEQGDKVPPEERKDRHTQEVEAESIAYTVCQHYGIDTSDYSFGYVAGWSRGKELTELKGSLDLIRATASEIITGIDERMAEIAHGQESEEEFEAMA